MTARIATQQSDGKHTRDRKPSWKRLLAVGMSAIAASTLATVLGAAALRGLLAVPAEFTPLSTPSVASLTVLGVTMAVLAFAALTRLRRDPVNAFTVVASIALVVSWVPDILVYVARAFPGTTLTGVLSLMSLHLVAAGIAIPLLRRYGLRPAAQVRQDEPAPTAAYLGKTAI